MSRAECKVAVSIAFSAAIRGAVLLRTRVCRTKKSYVAAKRILMWLRDRAKLGVTYGSPQIKGMCDLQQPDDQGPGLQRRRKALTARWWAS